MALKYFPRRHHLGLVPEGQVLKTDWSTASPAEKRRGSPVSAVCPASGPVCRLVVARRMRDAMFRRHHHLVLCSLCLSTAAASTHRSIRSVPGPYRGRPSMAALPPVTAMPRCRPKSCIRPAMHVGRRAEHMLLVNDPQLGRMAECLVCLQRRTRSRWSLDCGRRGKWGGEHLERCETRT